MKRMALYLLWFCSLSPVFAGGSTETKETKLTFLQAARHRLHQVLYDGTIDLYITGYAWHNRYTYDPAKIGSYNEFAAGGGLGRGFFDEDGDWHALAVIGFSDSHRNFQPAVGYAFLKMFYLPQTVLPSTFAGVGFNWFATVRKDIWHGRPFLGFPLPMVSVGTGKAMIFATYVPGGRNIGNVLFIFGKWTF